MPDEGEGIDESKRATLRRFAALGAASPLTRLSTDSASDTPDAIAGYLSRTPGAHFSKIRDDLQLGTGETQHHLRELERAGAIESRRDGDYRRFFPAGRFSAFERELLGHLRRKTSRRVLVALLRDPGASASELADAAGVSRPTVSRTAAALESAGILSREDGYTVEHPETVLVLLVRYAESFGPDVRELARETDDLVRYDP